MGKSKHQTHHSEKVLSENSKNVHHKKIYVLKPNDGKRWNKHSYYFDENDDI